MSAWNITTKAARRTHVVVVLACMAAAITMGAVRWTTPSDGTVVQISNHVWHADRLRVDLVVGEASALRAGDVVIAVDGASLDALAHQSQSRLIDRQDGSRHVYTVIRNGETIQVPVLVERFPGTTFLVRSWPALLLLVLFLIVGVYAFWRRPDDPSARALLLIAGLLWPGTYGWLLGDQVLKLAYAGPTLLLLLSEVPLALIWSFVLRFILTFPGGPRWARRTRIQALALAAPGLLYLGFLAVVLPGAASRYEALGRALQVSLPSSSVLSIVAAVLFGLIYLQISEQTDRRRAGTIAASLGLAALLWLMIWTVPAALGWQSPNTNYVALAFIPCPAAVAVAVLRYRLFELDPVKRRLLIRLCTATLVVTTFLAAAWCVVFLSPHTPFALPLAAGVTAALAPPLSTKIRTLLGRRVLGGRDQPLEVVASLQTPRTLPPAGEHLGRLTNTLGAALNLSFVSIDVTGFGDDKISARYGVDRGEGLQIPLNYGAEHVGTLVLDAGPGREPFGDADRELVEALRGHVGSIAYNVRLSGQLQFAREQLVIAREEQRLRLHNRLHDGLGASLAGTKMKAEAAAYLLWDDPHRAEGFLRDVVAECIAMVGELRDVVLDLRPPLLGQLGLAEAIRERGAQLGVARTVDGQGMLVEVVERQPVGSPPAAVEIAAYWIAVEAINNAVRHAQAPHCWVVLDWRAQRGSMLELSITDHGIGLPQNRRVGGGTISMSRRAEELGGQLVLERPDAGGTSVRALIPLHRPTAENRQ